MRESPTYVLMDEFKRRGAEVAYHDPFIPVVRPTREHGHWTGTQSVAWTREVVAVSTPSSSQRRTTASTTPNWPNGAADCGYPQCDERHRHIRGPALEILTG